MSKDKRLVITINVTETERERIWKLRRKSKKSMAELFRESLRIWEKFYFDEISPVDSSDVTPPPMPGELMDESEPIRIKIETSYPPSLRRKDITHEQ